MFTFVFFVSAGKNIHEKKTGINKIIYLKSQCRATYYVTKNKPSVSVSVSRSQNNDRSIDMTGQILRSVRPEFSVITEMTGQFFPLEQLGKISLEIP